MMVYLYLLFVGICSAGSAWTNNDDCFVMRPDNRSHVGDLNSSPGRYLNIFPDLFVPRDSRLTSVTFYAVWTGHVFISFWEETGHSIFKLLHKVFIEASATGVITFDLIERVWLASGSIIGVHYDEQDPYGIIDYEQSDRPEPTPNVPVYDVYIADTQDNHENGWMPGHTINMMGRIFSSHKNLALHLNLCPCSKITFGPECVPCNITCLQGQCDGSTGHCELGCIDGYRGQFCETFCPDGMFGKNCDKVCSGQCSNHEVCDPITGFCGQGCASGFDFDASKHCNVSCSFQRFGPSCIHKCHCQDGDDCDHVTGYCPRACADGYQGPSCFHLTKTQTAISEDKDMKILAVCLPLLLIILCCVPIVIILVKIWRKVNRNSKKSNDNGDPQAVSLDDINIAPGYEALHGTAHTFQSRDLTPNTDSSIYEQM